MLKYLCGLFFLLTVVSSKAQNKFSEGYIVNKTNDTATGYLMNDDIFNLAHQVSFKPTPEYEEKLYTKELINSFGYKNGNLFRLIQYKDFFDKNILKKTFAKLLVEGKYTLYTIPKNDKLYYYLEDQEGKTYFLYNDIKSTMGVLEHYGNYRQIFYNLLLQYPKMQIKAQKLSYTEKDLSYFVGQINDMISPGVSTIHYSKSKKEIKFFGYAGGMYYANGSQVTAQGQLRLYDTDLSRKSSLVSGFSYARVRDQITKETRNYLGEVTVKITNEISEVYSIPFVFQYNLTESIIQPYVYAGISLAHLKQNFGSDAKGFQTSTGVALVGGIGIEAYPLKKLIIKADLRYELLIHYPVIGIAYKFN
jgi:hypothetical protein